MDGGTKVIVPTWEQWRVLTDLGLVPVAYDEQHPGCDAAVILHPSLSVNFASENDITVDAIRALDTINYDFSGGAHIWVNVLFHGDTYGLDDVRTALGLPVEDDQ